MAAMARPPSSALLSILAVLATASHGSPTPPPFLCPFLNDNNGNIPRPSVPPPHLPSKFVQCDDGLWRRATSYTLYGSTFPCTTCTPLPTQGPPLPPQAAPPGGDLGELDDIKNSLPLGWNKTPQQNERRTALILSLSLVLTFIICAFIIGCVFWRKKIIKRCKRDPESEFKKNYSVSSVLAAEAKTMVEKENKAKLKIWARATARWKANVRHAARQRQGKRVASKSPQAHQPYHLSNNSRSRLTLSFPSPTFSRNSSVVCWSDDPQPIIGECLSPMLSETISTPTISPHTNAATSPPAYHHGSQTLPIIHSNICNTISFDQPSSSLTAAIGPHSSPHAAHVATDDKTLLARLADLASGPPEEVSTLDAFVSAPAWNDELGEIPPDLIAFNDHPPNDTRFTSSLFPPPPSRELMATTDLYDYTFAFEDTAALEPEPSAPPFHPGSALDDHQIVASAPPLLDDTEFLVDVHPSAPQLDVGDGNPVGQDHDRMLSTSGPLPSTIVSSQDIRVCDDIILPGYRP